MQIFFFFFIFIIGHANPTLLDKKIGKLFCVPVCPNRGDDHLKDLQNLIENYHVRSFLLKQGTMQQARRMVAWLKKTANEPVLIVTDAEWGLGMTINDAKAYPKNKDLSELSSSEIYDVGSSIANDCIDLGIHLNLAPVVDVNLSDNSIIGSRSFGSNPETVANNALAITKGMKDAGLSICLKHFPGHGSVVIDSHNDLPISNKSMDQLRQEDLVPYLKLKSISPNSIMLAHILLTKIDPTYPATMSKKVVGFLKKLMGNNPLIISDALNMKALTNYYGVDDIATKAHIAGIDLLLYGDNRVPNVDEILQKDLPSAINSIKELYLKKALSEKQLDKTIKKINDLASQN